MVKKSISLHVLVHRLMFFIAAIPVLLFGFYIYKQSIENFRDDAKNDALAHIETISSMISQFDEFNKKSLITFTKNPLVQKLGSVEENHEDVIKLAEIYNNAYEEIESTYLGLFDGTMLISDRVSLPENYDPRTRPWFIQVLQSSRDTVITSPYRDAGNPENYVITYAQRAYINEEKDVVGVAGIDVNINDIRAEIKGIETTMDGTIMVVDSNNVLVVANKTDLMSTLEKDAALLQSFLNDGKNQGSIINIENRKYIFYSRINIDTGWEIIKLIPSVNVNAVFLRTTWIFAIFLLTALMCVSFVAKHLRKLITSPVDRILKQLDEIANGNYDSRINYRINAPKEFIKIKNAVNNMVEQIYEQTSKLIQKEQEINTQYEEIHALYEETTTLNETQEELIKELSESYRLTIKSLSNAIEANDMYTKGHCDRVRKLGLETVYKLCCNESDLRNWEYASLLHDVGKVGVPYHILNKSGKLNDEEFEMMKKHPKIGYKILREIPFLEEVAQIIYQHHERFDGKGYPNGLIGDEIHILSKILSVSDAFDAMITARPYRTIPLSCNEAINELLNGKGNQFDPIVVDAFVKSIKESFSLSHRKIS